jgi:hypothetical protein
MGLNADWAKDVSQQLDLEKMPLEQVDQEHFQLLKIQNSAIYIHLLSLNHQHSPEVLIDLQASYQLADKILIQLWEDVWLNRTAQVISRLKSLCGHNQRIHGRSTQVMKIAKSDAENFLQRYHLQGYAGGRYHFGLMQDQVLVLVASFSNKRNMKNREGNHTSAELIRFATKDGYTVIGGLSKLIKHYVQLAKPNDLMSYADRDWSQGKGYISSGFELKAVTPPVQFYLDPTKLQRYTKNSLAQQHTGVPVATYLQIFNTGNLKYVLDLS